MLPAAQARLRAAGEQAAPPAASWDTWPIFPLQRAATAGTHPQSPPLPAPLDLGRPGNLLTGLLQATGTPANGGNSSAGSEELRRSLGELKDVLVRLTEKLERQDQGLGGRPHSTLTPQPGRAAAAGPGRGRQSHHEPGAAGEAIQFARLLGRVLAVAAEVG